MIQLMNGSIFGTKCDLLVVPANNLGGVADSVYYELYGNELPYLHEHITVGDVRFIQITNKFSNALTIGYAASVDVYANSSNEGIIQSITSRIKNYCYEQSLQKVNIPLLGTGVGKLAAQVSYSILKKAFEKDTRIMLCIYVLDKDIYDELVAIEPPVPRNEIRNPRVFISYTGVDSNNRNWVKGLACRLRSNGINARVDMFHLKPGQDLPQWMTNELIMADKVLLICDKYYAQKADNRNGGVGWETMIIQGDMLSKQQQNKYLAILRDPDIDQSLPIYVKSKYALNWAKETVTEEDYKELLFNLFDCDIEPPIGEIPEFIKQKFA